MAKLKETLKDSLNRIKTECATSPALMTHVVLGYPSLAESLDIVRAMAGSGAQIIELQIPFSDPIADGPTIMRANEHSLALGVTPRDCMKAIEELSKSVEVPLLFMSYFNIVFTYGVETFCKDASNAGAQGLIVPDVPPEENTDGYWTISREHGLTPIPLVTPISSHERLEKIKSRATDGFLYCVATTGTTGARKSLAEDLQDYLAKMREEFSLPLAVGFGISKREHIEALGGKAEIAIVGSAMIDVVSKASGADEGGIVPAVEKFTAELAGR